MTTGVVRPVGTVKVAPELVMTVCPAEFVGTRVSDVDDEDNEGECVLLEEICVPDPVRDDVLLVLPGNDGPLEDKFELELIPVALSEDEIGGVAVVPLVEEGPVKVYVMSVASLLVEEVEVQP